MDDEILEKLVDWFPDPEYVLPLNPSYEPEIKPGTESDYTTEERQSNQPIFEALQVCNRAGLVEPVGEKHMYYAAVNEKACRLTFLGRYYRRLVSESQLS